MVQHFKQAQKLSQMIFPMIDDYELHYHEYLRKFEVEPRSNPKLYIGYWRGQIYNILKEFQKESSLQIELIEQSINHWEKWLSELFSKEQLQEYLQNKDEITMHTYLTILKFHIDNYEKYIGSKAYDLMQLPVDDFDVKRLLKELNLLRSNYIMVLKRVINFGNKRPDKVSLELQQTINRGLSTQYRSIILENKESQRKNLETSKKYLLQFCKLSAIRGDELLPNASAETKILTFCLICDKDEFIQKFRSD